MGADASRYELRSLGPAAPSLRPFGFGRRAAFPRPPGAPRPRTVQPLPRRLPARPHIRVHYFN